MKPTIIMLTLAALLSSGARLHATEKPNLQRGWIGGEYQITKHREASSPQRTGVFIKQVYAETPAAQGGLQPGDIIVAINGTRIKDLRGFYRVVEIAQPGSRMKIGISRKGESLEIPVTVGRETYHQWHSVMIGFHASAQFDLWPDPDFSLLPVAQYKRPRHRRELRSPEVISGKETAHTETQGERGVRSDEGWDVWLVLFGVNAHKRILAQEIVAPTTAMR